MNASLSPERCNEPLISLQSPVVAILAGGLATRLRPLTSTLPKSMLMLAGEPFIAHQLRLLSRQGLRRIVLCLGHFAEQIEGFVGDGQRFGCRVRYSRDGASPLGTGGAIRRALPLLEERFAVLYGDSYLPAPLLPACAAFETSGKTALMTIYRNRGHFDASNLQFAHGEIVRYDKRGSSEAMEHIDYGFSLYCREAFLRWPQASAFDLSGVQQALIAEKGMAACEVTDRFYEIGSPHGLRETERYLRSLAGLAPGKANSVPTHIAETTLVDVPA